MTDWQLIGPQTWEATRPDGVKVAVTASPSVVETSDGEWKFVLAVYNSPPRGGHVEWIVSHVLGHAQPSTGSADPA